MPALCRHCFSYKLLAVMEYKASLDGLARGITISILILFAVLSGVNISRLFTHPGDGLYILVNILVTVLLVSIVLICYAYRPAGYLLTDDHLVIRRPISKIVVPICEVKKVRVLKDEDVTGLIRTFGVGGMFGYYGKHYNNKLGHTTWYATRRNNLVFLQLSDERKLVLSPDDIRMAKQLESNMM
jgi:hypothetical protein